MQVFSGESKFIGKQMGEYYKSCGIKIAKPLINENLLKAQTKIYELWVIGKNVELFAYNPINSLSLQKKSLNQHDTFKILNDPKIGVFSDEPKFKTIWSLSLDMKNRNYRLYWNFFEGVKEDKLNF